MIGTERSSVDEDGMSVTFYLILFAIFIEKVLGDFVSLGYISGTFSLVIISS